MERGIPLNASAINICKKIITIQAVYVTVALVLLWPVCRFAVPQIQSSYEKQRLKEAFNFVCELDLAALNEDDFDLLDDFEGKHINFVITDSELNALYITEGSSQNAINRYIIEKIDDFDESLKYTQLGRSNNLFSTRAYAKIIQRNQTYYFTDRLTSNSFIAQECYRYCILTYFIFLFVCECILTLLSIHKYSKEIDKCRADMITMNMSFEKRDSRRKELFAKISHEFKTPLAIISSQAEMLELLSDKSDIPTAIAGQIKSGCMSIRDEIDRSNEMIRQILNYSASDAFDDVSFKKTPTDISELMKKISLKYESFVTTKRIKLIKNFDKNCNVPVDEYYLEQAISNYLMNAFEYVSINGTVRISTDGSSKDCVRISVFNEGTRIDKNDLDKIWSGYYRRSMAEGNMPHAGLGLYIVRNIVEAHNGSYGAQNKDNGVEFWMTLPRQ